MCAQGLAEVAVEQGHLGDLFQRQQPGTHAIVDVVGVVGNLVGQVAKLRLQRRAAARHKPLGHATRFGFQQAFRMHS